MSSADKTTALKGFPSGIIERKKKKGKWISFLACLFVDSTSRGGRIHCHIGKKQKKQCQRPKGAHGLISKASCVTFSKAWLSLRPHLCSKFLEYTQNAPIFLLYQKNPKRQKNTPKQNTKNRHIFQANEPSKNLWRGAGCTDAGG